MEYEDTTKERPTDWEIYQIKGWGKIHDRIEAKYQSLLKRFTKGKKYQHWGSLNIAKRIQMILSHYMEQFSDFGACDTEPQCCIYERLRADLNLTRSEFSRW